VTFITQVDERETVIALKLNGIVITKKKKYELRKHFREIIIERLIAIRQIATHMFT
jgi:hypothetical protein